MKPIEFETVTTKEQFENLKEFASSDGHILTDTSPAQPVIVTMSRNGKMFGYYHVHAYPIIMPAFHREHCSPRDFRDAVDNVSASLRLGSMSERFPNGTAFIALNKEPNIDTELIEKLGFVDIDRNIWQQQPWRDF